MTSSAVGVWVSGSWMSCRPRPGCWASRTPGTPTPWRRRFRWNCLRGLLARCPSGWSLPRPSWPRNWSPGRGAVTATFCTRTSRTSWRRGWSPGPGRGNRGGHPGTPGLPGHGDHDAFREGHRGRSSRTSWKRCGQPGPAAARPRRPESPDGTRRLIVFHLNSTSRACFRMLAKPPLATMTWPRLWLLGVRAASMMRRVKRIGVPSP